MVKNWLVNRNVFFVFFYYGQQGCWSRNMSCLENSQFCHILPQHWQFHSLFWLSYYWEPHVILIIEIKWKKQCLFLIWRPCHNTCCNRAHIGIASTEAKSQLVSTKRTSVWDKQHKHLICADRGYKLLALDSLTLNCAKTSSINPHNCVLP